MPIPKSQRALPAKMSQSPLKCCPQCPHVFVNDHRPGDFATAQQQHARVQFRYSEQNLNEESNPPPLLMNLHSHSFAVSMLCSIIIFVKVLVSKERTAQDLAQVGLLDGLAVSP